MDVTTFLEDGTTYQGRGEIHAGWVLEGRAIQDVWIGADPRGGSMRWTFSDIERESFRWTGERTPDEQTWRREVEIHARRVERSRATAS